MSRDHRCSRPSLVHWGWSSVLGWLCLLCLALAACGGPATQRSPTPTTPPPTATINAKGAEQTLGATPQPTTSPPYAFPGAWANASWTPLGGATNPTTNPTAYAFAPLDGHVGYLCSPSDGHLYITRDGGDSWSRLRLSIISSCEVLIDPRDASDVFVVTASVTQTSGASESFDLWRSADGGASWSKLGAPPQTGMRLAWSQMASIGSRLIGALQVDQEGYLQNGLVVSSDGGMTWKPFAQSVANQGYTIGGFTLMGSAIYIDTTKGTNPGGMERRLWARSSAQSAVHPLAAPLSGQPNASVFWRSLDGGVAWSQVTLPGGIALPGVQLYATGHYALAVADADISTGNQNPLYDAQIWWSADDGAAWTRLPDMRGLENGYVIAGSGSNGELALAPDGSVILSAQHAEQSYGDDAGAFRIRMDAASPVWTPLVAGGVQYWQVSQTATGLRLWGAGSFAGDSHLKYVDLP